MLPRSALFAIIMDIAYATARLRAGDDAAALDALGRVGELLMAAAEAEDAADDTTADAA